jgi:hypothetical protein
VALNLTIPPTTLSDADGLKSYGPVTLHQADSAVLLTIDRAVAGGFNSVAPTVAMHVEIDYSPDGGATWTLLVAGDISGGVTTDRNGTRTTSTLGTGTDLVKSAQLRATVQVTGGTVTVAGSLAVS